MSENPQTDTPDEVEGDESLQNETLQGEDQASEQEQPATETEAAGEGDDTVIKLETRANTPSSGKVPDMVIQRTASRGDVSGMLQSIASAGNKKDLLAIAADLDIDVNAREGVAAIRARLTDVVFSYSDVAVADEPHFEPESEQEAKELSPEQLAAEPVVYPGRLPAGKVGTRRRLRNLKSGREFVYTVALANLPHMQEISVEAEAS